MKFDLKVRPGVPCDFRQDAGIAAADEASNSTTSRRPDDPGKIDVTLHRWAGHDEFPGTFQGNRLSMALLDESAHGEDVVEDDVAVLAIWEVLAESVGCSAGVLPA